MLTRTTITRINNRRRSVSRLPLLAIGGGAMLLAALLYVLEALPSFALMAPLLVGVLLVLVLYSSQKSRTTVFLSYKGNLNEVASARFVEVREVLEELASSEKIWRLTEAAQLPEKAADVAPSPEREAARVGLLPTPGIRADVPIWGIEAGEQESIFFFPEGLLLYKNDHYEPLSYKLLKVAFSSARFFEEEELPEDANVVESVWRFSRPDGGPDPRYKKDNVQIPVVLYNLLEISTPSGLEVRLLISSRRAAARFAKTFGAEEPRKARRGEEEHGSTASSTGSEDSFSKERQEAYSFVGSPEREASLASARKTLGLARGASTEEIVSAYRELARTHHPDKVANLAPEVKEYSEQRMKEINAAYSLLKHQRNDPATEGARVG
jgi:DnaJ domain